MSAENKKVPDHSLQGADIPADKDSPKVYAVADLRAYVKPDLSEELGSPTGGLANCGTETLCSCVPVETCVCNTVTYHQGGSTCPGNCPCDTNCVCVSLYWFPY